jgi:hypothetical protein
MWNEFPTPVPVTREPVVTAGVTPVGQGTALVEEPARKRIAACPGAKPVVASYAP